MPKLLTGAEHEIGIAIRGEAAGKGRRLKQEEVEALVDSHEDMEFVGSGRGCAVIARKGRPEEVIAFQFKDMEPREAKRVFYLQSVVATLFPHNFPHFRAVGGRDEERRSAGAAIRQRVRGRKAWEDCGEDLDVKAKYPFRKVWDTCRSLELPVAFDSFMENFALGESNGVYYLDTVRSMPWRKWDIPAIRRFMNEAKTDQGAPAYTARDKRIVEKSIRRLAGLGMAEIVE